MKNPTSENPNMVDNILFEHFATLATAPDGIARLRELILQLAVQGKLGTQDASDEPVSVLLERIKKDKEKLVNEGKIKREKPLEQLVAGSYNLPDSWQLCTLGEISEIIMGNSPPGDTYNKNGDGIPLINGPTEFSKDPLGKTIVSQYTTQPTKYCKENDLLICVRGATTGRTNIAGFDACIGRGVAVIRSPSIQQYLNLFILTKAQQILNMGTGSTFPSISQNNLLTIPVPLPPLVEQHRIVAKIDRLMALCEELETRQQQERAGCLRLGTASLAGLQNAGSPEEFERLWVQVCDAFDLILDCPENVAVLRQTILKLAIYGKFKTQNATDKPVKINEKNNDNPNNRSLNIFNLINLPKNWKWTKLGNIAKIGQGGTPSTNFPEYWNGSVPWLRSGDIKFNRIKKANETISELGLTNSAATLCPIGTVMLAMTGQGVTRGRAAILDIETSANQSCAHIILNKDVMIPEFLFYFFRTEYWNIRTLDKGTGQPGLNTKIIKMFDLPLPPLAEQHRIVAKVDALMALCDELEARLKERAGVQGRLAGAVVKVIANV